MASPATAIRVGIVLASGLAYIVEPSWDWTLEDWTLWESRALTENGEPVPWARRRSTGRLLAKRHDEAYIVVLASARNARPAHQTTESRNP